MPRIPKCLTAPSRGREEPKPTTALLKLLKQQTGRSEPARREVLQRLLKLNQERYAEEVKQGLHDKKKASRKRKPARKQEASLFDRESDT